ncbi:XRE family transcriptional regulator [bacterium]|nr:XRE family transcriptional regulator [bacterium]
MFTPSRLILARQKRGLSKKDLAELIGVTAQSISNFESEIVQEIPSQKTLLKLSQILNFPIDFFAKEKVSFISSESASFRALSKMTASQRDAALASGVLAFEVNKWIECNFELPTHELPDLRNETPESAATYLRQIWLLGEKPIPNMIHLLESKGIRVYFIAEDYKNVDAFSIWDDGTPFILLNTFKSAERSRFDAAHELGHLVLHKHGVPRNREAETEANRFASEFLMPHSSMIAKAPKLPTYQNLINLKHYWSVSLAAVVYRLKTLNLITEWQHRTLIIDMGKKGYNTNEPYSIPKEHSQIFEKVFETLKNEGFHKNKLASELCISIADLQKLTSGTGIVLV